VQGPEFNPYYCPLPRNYAKTSKMKKKKERLEKKKIPLKPSDLKSS
jgi:hypothetical protein